MCLVCDRKLKKFSQLHCAGGHRQYFTDIAVGPKCKAIGVPHHIFQGFCKPSIEPITVPLEAKGLVIFLIPTVIQA